ncbi:MAG: glutaredoxin family protein [Rubrobacteraceae bacterium]
MSKVVLFSTPSCGWCRRAKRYFRESSVPFKEVNMEKDQGAARDIQRKTGQTGVPVIKIGGKWIVGFDRPATEHELGRRAG